MESASTVALLNCPAVATCPRFLPTYSHVAASPPLSSASGIVCLFCLSMRPSVSTVSRCELTGARRTEPDYHPSVYRKRCNMLGTRCDLLTNENPEVPFLCAVPQPHTPFPAPCPAGSRIARTCFLCIGHAQQGLLCKPGHPLP